jgi:response regulator of citrate/malate metabolism
MTLKVLVVDDDFMVSRVHRGYVERVPGFLVVGEAHTAAEAIELVDKLRPDLVLLDIYLPDMSGVDLLRTLRAPGMPPVDVLVVSAARDVEIIQQSMQSGAIHYIIKPFGFAALQERLARFADTRRRLGGMAEASQDDVDRLYGASTAGRGHTLPKGLSPATHALVSGILQGAGGHLSALDVAEQAGVSRASARRYLDHLVTTGRAELSMRYGSAGRPEHRYRWAGS